jgi:hypothetical protein
MSAGRARHHRPQLPRLGRPPHAARHRQSKSINFDGLACSSAELCLSSKQCETHVSHHVSSKIPHYNAWKATEALKEFLGPHYQWRDGHFLVDLYRNVRYQEFCAARTQAAADASVSPRSPLQFRDCAFVDEGKDVIFYKSRSGVAKKIGVFKGQSGAVSDSGVDGVETLVDAKQK